MKKLFFTLACLASFSFYSNAQIRITPAAGVNLANLGGDAEGTDMKIGAHVGAYVAFPLGEVISVQPGVFYSMKGAKSGDASLNLNYLEIPVNLVYSFGGGEGFMINAGPYLGLLMSAKAEDVDVKDLYSSTDFGVNLGVGYQLPMGLMIRAQYGLGLANIASDDLKAGTDMKLSNNVIGITLGYTLGGGN